MELKKKEENYEKLEGDYTSKETEWLIAENTLRGKLRQMEEKKLRQKVEYEEKFKSMDVSDTNIFRIFIFEIEGSKGIKTRQM